MIIVAAYDVASDGRRARVAAILQAWGDRVQKSVYVLDVTPETLSTVTSRATAVMDLDDDSLYLFPVCAADWAKVVCIGQAEPPQRVLFWAAL